MATHVTTAICFLKGVTYKPGWSIHFNPTEFQQNHITMRIGYSAQDSRTTEKKIVAVMAIKSLYVDEHTNLFSLLDDVRRNLEQVEMHELDEWFKLNGKVVNDPHVGYLSSVRESGG